MCSLKLRPTTVVRGSNPSEKAIENWRAPYRDNWIPVGCGLIQLDICVGSMTESTATNQETRGLSSLEERIHLLILEVPEIPSGDESAS